MTTNIAIIIDGIKYEGWHKLNISRYLDAMCGRFDFTLADFAVSETAGILSGKSVKVEMVDEFNDVTYPLINGYIYPTERSKTAEATSLHFSGRDVTSDLVDCSAIYKTSTWKKQKLSKIARDLCQPFGIAVVIEGVTDPMIEKFTLQSGETVSESLERLCRAFNVLAITDEVGRLLLTAVGSDTADEALVMGDNILTMHLGEDFSERFSTYNFKGQRKGNGSEWVRNKDTQLLGQAHDAGVDRYRPMVFNIERHTTRADIKKRAAWEAQVRAGRSIYASVTVPGWLQNPYEGTSRPWRINELVTLKDTSWNIDAKLVVSGVDFQLDESTGRITTLDLNPPEIFKANPTQTIELARWSSVTPTSQ